MKALPGETDAVVVGAGPAGLAVSACLNRTGVEHLLIEREGSVASAWRRLVVGFGNSGGEIALDLVEHGARPVVSVRSPVNIVPRDVLGIPVLALAIPLSRLPPRVADTLVWPILKAYYPSYRRFGLRKADRGPFQQIAEAKKIPLLDIGTVRAIRRGRIRVEGEVLSMSDRTVTFASGNERGFDAVILATGYRPCLPSRDGVSEGADLAVFSDELPGLYHCGFYVTPTGMFREIAIEAELIAGKIASRRGVGVAES